MIRLFRKIRSQLLSEDKYGTYLLYAGGEVLLVVVGILLALQIDNWNDDRNTRRAEQLLLNGLRLELLANQEQLSIAMDYHAKSRNAAKRILEIYNGSFTYRNYQEVDSLLALLQWAWTYDPSMGALNSIKMSGHLNSVQNAELRAMITKYEDLTNDAREESEIILNLIIDKYTLEVNKYVSLNQRVKYLGDEYDVGNSAFPLDYEGLFKDRMIEGVISYIHTWRIDELGEEEYLKKMMDEFIAILDDEIDY